METIMEEIQFENAPFRSVLLVDRGHGWPWLVRYWRAEEDESGRYYSGWAWNPDGTVQGTKRVEFLASDVFAQREVYDVPSAEAWMRS
jgi:hypothetical protein